MNETPPRKGIPHAQNNERALFTTTDAACAPPLARIANVHVCFGQKTVFSDLSLSLYKGGHLALVGSNGAGKSTLLRLLQGELRPPQKNTTNGSQGHIFWNFNGHEESSALVARQHVRTVSPAQQGMYTRQGWLVPGREILLSGIDNATLVYGETPPAFWHRAEELAKAAHASRLLDVPATVLSQGQLRLLLILRALMSHPALLLLDEPFDGLDATARQSVEQCIFLAAQRGSTLILSAHRRKDIPHFFQTALLLHKGRAQLAPVANLPWNTWNNGIVPEKTVTAAPASAFETTPCPLATARLDTLKDKHTTNAPQDLPFLQALRQRRDPLLHLAHVNVFINRVKVLFDISWTVCPGQHWTISGPNGSGKSTLLRLLYGDEFAACGGVLSWCNGLRPPLNELRAGVGYVSDRLQDLYDYDLSAEETVISGLKGTIGLYHIPKRSERDLAHAWLKRMGADAYAEQPFYSLSSGMARRVMLARALAGAPPVLLLDEPCSGLDSQGRALFLAALPVLAAQGVTLFYISHHESDIPPLFTHDLRMEGGRILFSGSRHAACNSNPTRRKT